MWELGGDAGNGWPLSSGVSDGWAQILASIGGTPNFTNFSGITTQGQWAGRKEEGSPFNNIALYISIPPGVFLTWDSTGDEWRDAAGVPYRYTHTGSVNNDSGSGYQPELYLLLILEADSYCHTDNEANRAYARAECYIESFFFGF